jgi:hypothetical protein
MKKLTEQEMEIYLKFSDWIRVDNESWHPTPFWFNKNLGIRYSTLEAFDCQMKEDGHEII